MRVSVLGCGASGGVPLIGNDWGECDPAEPRNRRLRSSILIESGATAVLVDASPDCRAQLLAAGVDHLDAVVFTHAHADHVHGIDDLRWVNVAMGRAIPVYGSAETLARIESGFGYAFSPPDPAAGGSFYKPCLEPRPFEGVTPFTIGDLEFRPIRQDHGFSESYGFRIGDFAYDVDVVRLDERALDALRGVRHWIVGCLGRRPHPTHAHLERVLEWTDALRPGQAWLSHMSVQLDYRTLLAELPETVRPAHDGLRIEIGDTAR